MNTDIIKTILDLPVWSQQKISMTEKNVIVTMDASSQHAIITFTFACQLLWPIISAALQKQFPGIKFELQQKILQHVIQSEVQPRVGVKNIIAIASGKGGVGKSTVAVNLALALQAEGASVGILDADIYGPSLPLLLNLAEPPESENGKTLEPIVRYGLQAMSIGCLLQEKDTAMIWRGPMASTAMQQIFRDCQWKDLDYLMIDLPPGTGDIQLTLAQKIPVSGIVIVTTPQDIALIDAQKAYRMFEKVNIPVLGVVENMSYHICEKCGHHEALFGEGGGESLQSDYGLELLGKLPLTKVIREDCDQGEPTVVHNPNSEISQLFKEIAMRVSALLANRAVYKPSRIPKISVE